jgi:HD-GYP domain-containing protein (c-di-GMP phosphodiesterase class II)
MPLRKKQVPVEDLEFGVYISELDRPWTETPLLFQGFILREEKELETIRQYCRTVTIDLEKGSDLPGMRPPRGGKTGARSVLASIRTTVQYEEKVGVEQELPVARAIQSKAELLVKDMFSALQAGKALDAPRVKEAVTSMTDSIVRNRDAMLLLAKMKEKGEHALDRAFGVSIYMITFGRFLQLPREQLDLLGMLGLLQDIGKTRIPENVLNKKEPLTDAESELCKRHVEYSVEILKEAAGLPAELPGHAALHHERHDGSGYPGGLRGTEIGLFGAIAGLVDCFDVLTHPRPYAEAMAPSNALSMLYSWRGTQFDRAMVEQFIQCIGIFPVGALVELNSGDVGIVIAQNLVRRLQPRVMVVIDAKGNRLNPPRILDLAREPKMDRETSYRIKRTLETGNVAIDPSEFFI